MHKLIKDENQEKHEQIWKQKSRKPYLEKQLHYEILKILM